MLNQNTYSRMEDSDAIAWLQSYLPASGCECPQCNTWKHSISAIRKLAWYEAREPYVRALTGAAEDWTVNELGEWRMLVTWEQDNKQPKDIDE